ncbi:unnamed protein product [Aureobasidium mustum]|uniref:Uncharacterized protein n=1 Tax=Aureobasidium mustum TaxID=2773714 RepID=A0A9N8PI22_9PEZI|nr:unnamed protein product [Aureobasidium mustum]
MSYRTYEVTPGQPNSNYQSDSYGQPPSYSQATSYRSPPSYSQATSYGQPTTYDRPDPYAHARAYTQQSSYAQPGNTIRYVPSVESRRNAQSTQSVHSTQSIDRRRSSDNEPLMIRRQRRIDEIADNLPLRTRRMYPQTAQNIYRQDLVFDHTSHCRDYDGRFYCYCGHRTSQQHRSILHATSVHYAPTPYVCPACGVHCPRGLYQYNAHLQEYHPELVQHAALQYRNDRFIRRDGSYYN